MHKKSQAGPARPAGQGLKWRRGVPGAGPYGLRVPGARPLGPSLHFWPGPVHFVCFVKLYVLFRLFESIIYMAFHIQNHIICVDVLSCYFFLWLSKKGVGWLPFRELREKA